MLKQGAKNRLRIHWLARLLGYASIFFYVARCDAEVSQEFIRKVDFSNRNNDITVIYSDIGEPYRTVFLQIIAGIEAGVKGQVAAYPLGSNANTEMIKNNLHDQGAKVVIALGMQGLRTAVDLDLDIGVIVGGVIASPERELPDYPIYLLSPEPALLFSHLKKLMPATRRIYTVYDPNRNGWLIDSAKRAARNQGLELVALEATDLHTAVSRYREIFKSADNRIEALWLLQDSTTVEDGSVLPMVLQESWNRNLAVFSSNPGHVRRGVLFSLFPDNVLLGRDLANAALSFLSSRDYSERGTILLRDVQMAINLRTAQHLELNLDSRLKFGMVFPER